jgi:hypothetical protein
MTNHDAIMTRKSRRKFVSQPLSAEEKEVLLSAIKQGNKAGSLSMQLVENKPELFGGFFRSYGLFVGVEHFIVMAGPKKDIHLAEKLGYYGEKVLLEAVKLGLGTCWVGGSFNKQGVNSLVSVDDLLIAVIVIGEPVNKYTAREQLIRSITHLKKEQQSKFFQTDGSEPSWFMQAIDYVYRAPSAVNQQPVWVNVASGKITARLRNINHFAWVDLGIAKAHFEYAAPSGRFEWGNNAFFHQ